MENFGNSVLNRFKEKKKMKFPFTTPLDSSSHPLPPPFFSLFILPLSFFSLFGHKFFIRSPPRFLHQSFQYERKTKRRKISRWIFFFFFYWLRWEMSRQFAIFVCRFLFVFFHLHGVKSFLKGIEEISFEFQKKKKTNLLLTPPQISSFLRFHASM